MTIKDIELKDLNCNASFSVDLHAQAKKHLVFLHCLHKLGITTQYLEESKLDEPIRKYAKTLGKFGVTTINFRGDEKAFVCEAVRRYSELWLPMVADVNISNNRSKKRKPIDLIPPPDIAWLWHCHRLAPYRYSSHFKRLYGYGSSNASHPFVFQIDTDTLENSNETWSDDENETYLEIAKGTRDLFAELYPSESFFGTSIVGDNPAPKRQTKLAESRFLSRFDVVAACQRQATFLWHVSGPKFSDDAFLREGVDNYLRFVKLTNHPQRSSSNTKMWLVPTYQIDCLWHTHILSNIQNYHTDVKQITGGAILDHDDSINDRSEGGVLDTSFQETKELWKQVYGLDYFVKGGMYNGEPPVEFYRQDCFVPSSLPKISAKNLTQKLVVDNHNSASSLYWMASDDRRAFIPYRRGEPKTWVNPYKEKYVFGLGNQGYGYYHMKTSHGNEVLIDRCKRKMRDNNGKRCFLYFIDFVTHVLFVTLLLVYGAIESELWFLYGTFGCVLFPLILWYKERERNELKKTLDDAERHMDAMEGGGYALYNEVPDTESLVGAAACGFSPLYRRPGGGGCGGGYNGFFYGGGGCGCGVYGGGVCGGGGGCGGGGCGGF